MTSAPKRSHACSAAPNSPKPPSGTPNRCSKPTGVSRRPRRRSAKILDAGVLHRKIDDMSQIRLLNCRTMPDRKFYLSLLAAFLFAATAFAQQTQHLFFHVTLGPQIAAPVSGRLLIFLKEGTGDKEIDVNPFLPSSVSIAAKEVYYWKPGALVDVDTDDTAFPEGFSHLKPGDYKVQAVLDVDHSYNY